MDPYFKVLWEGKKFLFPYMGIRNQTGRYRIEYPLIIICLNKLVKIVLFYFIMKQMVNNFI